MRTAGIGWLFAGAALLAGCSSGAPLPGADLAAPADASCPSTGNPCDCPTDLNAAAAAVGAACAHPAERCSYFEYGLVCGQGLWACDPCGPLQSPTGAPCSSDLDCAPGLGSDQPGRCVLSTEDGGVVWPMGYCSSSCRTSRTDPSSRINGDCPGGTATCIADGATGTCGTLCLSPASCRSGYGCALLVDAGGVCEPASLLDGGVDAAPSD